MAAKKIAPDIRLRSGVYRKSSTSTLLSYIEQGVYFLQVSLSDYPTCPKLRTPSGPLPSQSTALRL